MIHDNIVKGTASGPVLFVVALDKVSQKLFEVYEYTTVPFFNLSTIAWEMRHVRRTLTNT